MLNCLNKFRINGFFTLDDKSFTNLGELLNKILDEIIIHKDYNSAKYCIILSQTFFKPSCDIVKKKIFLQSVIENHEIWKNIDVWEQMIKRKLCYHLVSINEEMNKQSLFSLYNFENPNDEKSRIENSVFGQLIIFIENMMSFDVNKQKVKDLVMEFCKIHSMSEELTLQISKQIDEYNVNTSQFIRNELVDDNLAFISDEFTGKHLVNTLIIKDSSFYSKNMENDLKTSNNLNYIQETSDNNEITLK